MVQCVNMTGGIYENNKKTTCGGPSFGYIAYTSPFVTYYLLVILCERYFTDAYMLYPPNWINPDVWPYGFWGAVIFLLELTLAFGILFVIRAGRRLREL